MLKHHQMKYIDVVNKKIVIISWLQVNVLGKCWHVSRRRTEVTCEDIDAINEMLGVAK